MFYTIYKTTNQVNGKYYIGKHQTKDLQDGYLGSGKLLKAAIAKYGKDNFTKEILFVFDTEAEMNAKEKELVVVSEETYNLCPGGHGGFGYINRAMDRTERVLRCKRGGKIGGKIAGQKHVEKCSHDLEYKKKFYTNNSNVIKEKIKNGGYKHLATNTKGKSWKIDKSLKHQRGKNNSQFGTMWITDGKTNKKIPINNQIAVGWYRGRIVNITI